MNLFQNQGAGTCAVQNIHAKKKVGETRKDRRGRREKDRSRKKRANSKCFIGIFNSYLLNYSYILAVHNKRNIFFV